MELHRHFDPVGLIEQILDAAAVVAHAEVDCALRCGQISEPATEAVADRRNLASHFRHGAQHGCRRADIANGETDVGLLQDFDAFVTISAGVGQFDARLGAPENIRGERHVTILRILVGNRADVAVHAEDFLDDDYRRSFAAFGQRQVTLETVVTSRDVDPLGSHAHVALLQIAVVACGHCPQRAPSLPLKERPCSESLGGGASRARREVHPSPTVVLSRNARLVALRGKGMVCCAQCVFRP